MRYVALTTDTLSIAAVYPAPQPQLDNVVEIPDDDPRYAIWATVPPVSYRTLRAAAYPPIGDQLDMIYHAGLGGAAFQAAIAAVKATHPKGTP